MKRRRQNLRYMAAYLEMYVRSNREYRSIQTETNRVPWCTQRRQTYTPSYNESNSKKMKKRSWNEHEQMHKHTRTHTAEMGSVWLKVKCAGGLWKCHQCGSLWELSLGDRIPRFSWQDANLVCNLDYYVLDERKSRAPRHEATTPVKSETTLRKDFGELRVTSETWGKRHI